MRHLSTRLRAGLSQDSGMGLIEVLVGALIMAVVMTGIAYSTVNALRMSRDAQSREVASNLASSEMDLVRAIGDPMTVYSDSYTKTVDGVPYTVTRSAGWKSTTGTTSGCGIGTGSLQYKLVNVSVSWTSKSTTTKPVVVDTLLAPTSRINDPDFGTLFVSVLAADGTGSKGVSVTATPVEGGAPVSMPATDVDGCSYAFKVTPGKYKITITRSNSISDSQVVSPNTTIPVAKGTASTAAFQYDKWATFNVDYRTPVGSSSDRVFPTALDVTYTNSFGTWTFADGAVTTEQLHPFAQGYSVIAGQYKPVIAPSPPSPGDPGCLSPDPASWDAATVNGVALADGERLPAVSAAPGESAPIVVPMGVITVTSSNNVVYRAENVTAPITAADPGCATPRTYVFPKISGNGTKYLVLPYGTWRISKQGLLGSWTDVTSTLTGIVGGVLGPVVGTAPGLSTITLDPRRPA